MVEIKEKKLVTSDSEIEDVSTPNDNDSCSTTSKVCSSYIFHLPPSPFNAKQHLIFISKYDYENPPPNPVSLRMALGPPPKKRRRVGGPKAFSASEKQSNPKVISNVTVNIETLKHKINIHDEGRTQSCRENPC